MSINPYESPLTPPSSEPVIGVLSGNRADLRAIARYQKVILVCVLVYLLAMIARFVLPPELFILFALGVVLAAIVGAVFVFLLAIKVYGIIIGILYAFLSLVPLVGLLMLFIINGKATTVLKQNGIKVGFMGADLSTI